MIHDKNGHLIGYDPQCTQCQQQPVKLKISFDIGGVLSKYPNVFRPIIEALQLGGIEAFVITDMHDHAQSVNFVLGNGFNIPADHILNSDYATHGENCKAITIEKNHIDVHVDDFPGYCAHTKCVSLFVWPNPEQAYYADDFKTDGSEGNFGRRVKAPKPPRANYSSTYGDLPRHVQEMILPHEWDNMSISEQRDWCLGRIGT